MDIELLKARKRIAALEAEAEAAKAAAKAAEIEISTLKRELKLEKGKQEKKRRHIILNRYDFLNFAFLFVVLYTLANILRCTVSIPRIGRNKYFCPVLDNIWTNVTQVTSNQISYMFERYVYNISQNVTNESMAMSPKNSNPFRFNRVQPH